MISVSSIRLNLSDLNSFKDNVSDDMKDAIERVTDDVMDMLEKIDEIKSGIYE